MIDTDTFELICKQTMDDESLNEILGNSLDFLDLDSDDAIRDVATSSDVEEEIDGVIQDCMLLFDESSEMDDIIRSDAFSEDDSCSTSSSRDDAISMSLEAAMKKLDDCMRRTARSRSMVTKNVPSLRKALNCHDQSNAAKPLQKVSSIKHAWKKQSSITRRAKLSMRPSLRRMSLKNGLMKSSRTGVKSSLFCSQLEFLPAKTNTSISDFLRQRKGQAINCL